MITISERRLEKWITSVSDIDLPSYHEPQITPTEAAKSTLLHISNNLAESYGQSKAD